MGMGYGLWQEQSQRLVMTPELRQAITVLQYSTLELLEFLEGELAVNPVIELVGPPIDWAELARSQRDRDTVGSSRPEVREDWLEPDLTQTITLAEHLTRQLQMQNITPDERRIGDYLIGN